MEEKKFSDVFKELYEVEIPTQYIKIGYGDGLAYLSWAYAFSEMSRRFDDFEVIQTNWDGKNYNYKEGIGCYVETTIKAGGFEKKWSLPVMDSRNNAILKPTTRDINDTIMRCAVKTIALFGLGMKIYEGEIDKKPVQQQHNNYQQHKPANENLSQYNRLSDMERAKEEARKAFEENPEYKKEIGTPINDAETLDQYLMNKNYSPNEAQQRIIDCWKKNNYKNKDGRQITTKSVDYVMGKMF